MHYAKAIAIVGLIIVALSGCQRANLPTTASRVDLQRYMGKWYEIASLPNKFQQGCRCTTAQYQLANRFVRITNQCIKGNNKQPAVARGKAWAVTGSHNSKLKVQFFWPFRGDYWILYVSPGYRYALVGSPNRKYLWILARRSRLNRISYQRMVAIANAKGYDTNRLQKTLQNCSN